ncbi:hypothetical protein PUF88_06730 [Lactobacillaceae bacterium L1_55_11]|nr:hypothetical protein [Lactobacillaceae bacterium L1_55_11]
MDSLDVAEDWQQVLDQVAILNARGHEISVDEVAALTLKRGLQEILDNRTDGTFYTVAWDSDGNLVVYDIYRDPAATLHPKGASLTQDFKDNAAGVWDYFNDQARALVGR